MEQPTTVSTRPLCCSNEISLCIGLLTVKIVLRGARGVGKTQLARRLQGLSFDKSYVPTREIATANINWSYKSSSDVIKVRRST